MASRVLLQPTSNCRFMEPILGKGSEHKDPPERFPPDGRSSHTLPYVMLTANIDEDLLSYIKEDIEFKRPEAIW